MANIQDDALLKLLPYSLRQDPVLVAIAEAAEFQLKEAYREAESLFNLVDIENVPELLLDLLAYEKHVDFYDVELPLNLKRAVIQASISQHRKKGTPYAIELVMDILKFNGKVSEWFEYNGRPYYFRVTTDQSLATNVDIKKLTSMIKEFKNTRSWLENITVDRKLDLGLNIGGAVSNYQNTHITPPKFELPDQHATIYQGFVIAKYDTFNIGLPQFNMDASTVLGIHCGAFVAKYETTQIEMPPFTIADAQLSRSYGGAFSSYMKTTILSKEVV